MPDDSTMAYDGASEDALASRLRVPRLALFGAVGSTMDIAHQLAAAGAPAGTLVLADEQTAGRGRLGRAWQSAPGRGIWLTLVERPRDPRAVDVLSIRLGIAAAAVLDRFAGSPVRLKWPNDLYVGDRKLAGILVEARWRDGRVDWVAIGFGLNVAPAEAYASASLCPGTARLDVLEPLVEALRGAAARTGSLDRDELRAFAARDLASGRRAESPAPGLVAGIDADGALLIDTDDGRRILRAGSLVLAEDP